MNAEQVHGTHSHSPDERYRLYVDESGDHVFKHLDQPGHRYLCVLGCFFQQRAYRDFHRTLEDFKQRHIPHSPDDPVILHRADIVNRRKCFWRLRDPAVGEAFDHDLLRLVADAKFRIVAVVIDKKAHEERYPVPAHPYNLALGFMLQRYCGFLNLTNRRGDVMAESRGGKEDKLLKASYSWVFERGVWSITKAASLQHALTSRELKIKPKSTNIAGLQLADLLGHPIRQSILKDKGRISSAPSRFGAELLEVAETKFNRHLYDRRIWGYGKVFFPE